MFQAVGYSVSYAVGAFTDSDEGRITKHEFDVWLHRAQTDVLIAGDGRWMIVDKGLYAHKYTTAWALELVVVVPTGDDSESQLRTVIDRFERFITRQGFEVNTKLRTIEGKSETWHRLGLGLDEVITA